MVTKKREERLRDEVGSRGFFVSRAPTWPDSESQIRTEGCPFRSLPVSPRVQNSGLPCEGSPFS